MKLNIFNTFAEAKEGQEYDHNYQKIISLAVVSGVNSQIIKDNNLHILQDNTFPLENYVVENNIAIEEPEIYQKTLEYWKITSAWSGYFKYQDKFAYTKDHSDRTYTYVEVDSSELINLDNDGNEIEITNI